MGAHILTEVDGEQYADVLNRFNGLDDTFPALKSRHFENGYWWLVYLDEKAVAFAGMVPNEPYDILGVGYLKRALVLPDHRGHALQLRLIAARVDKARQLGWTMLVSDCGPNNHYSARNFRLAQFERTDPEQKWAGPDDLYWRKVL
jgi:GNAT superfamily N-acetyltransferase